MRSKADQGGRMIHELLRRRFTPYEEGKRVKHTRKLQMSRCFKESMLIRSRYGTRRKREAIQFKLFHKVKVPTQHNLVNWPKRGQKKGREHDGKRWCAQR